MCLIVLLCESHCDSSWDIWLLSCQHAHKCLQNSANMFSSHLSGLNDSNPFAQRRLPIEWMTSLSLNTKQKAGFYHVKLFHNRTTKKWSQDFQIWHTISRAWIVSDLLILAVTLSPYSTLVVWSGFSPSYEYDNKSTNPFTKIRDIATRCY